MVELAVSIHTDISNFVLLLLVLDGTSTTPAHCEPLL